MQELKPCPNPKCQTPNPEIFTDRSHGLVETYVYCPVCLTRGPEFSICSNAELYATVAWDELPRATDTDALRAELDAVKHHLDLSGKDHQDIELIMAEFFGWKETVGVDLVETLPRALRRLLESNRAKASAYETLHPAETWTEEDSYVIWWRVPIEESPYIGTPNDTSWIDDYYTHWSVLPRARLEEVQNA